MKKFFAILLSSIALVFAGVSAPAQAHDEITGTYPEAGSTIEAGDITLSVSFNEDVMVTDNNAGIEFAVTAPDGLAVPVGCVLVSGKDISGVISIAIEGEYTVAWRSVSNDGHPSEGNYKFSVTNTSGFTAAEDINAACMARTTMVGSPMPMTMSGATDDSTGSDGDSDNSSMAWVGLVVGAVFIVIGSVAGAIVMRRREKKAESDPEILSDDK
jgi:methionine-rich copper-binding protein CopC